MDNFKIENAEGVFPDYKIICEAEMLNVQNQLKERFLLNKNSDLLALVEMIDSKMSIVNKCDARDDSFSLIRVMSKLEICPNEDIFINWYRFDDIDSMKILDLDHHFSDIWYPSSDDVEIFDETLSWMISIRHDGILKFMKM